MWLKFYCIGLEEHVMSDLKWVRSLAWEGLYEQIDVARGAAWSRECDKWTDSFNLIVKTLNGRGTTFC